MRLKGIESYAKTVIAAVRAVLGGQKVIPWKVMNAGTARLARSNDSTHEQVSLGETACQE